MRTYTKHMKMFKVTKMSAVWFALPQIGLFSQHTTCVTICSGPSAVTKCPLFLPDKETSFPCVVNWGIGTVLSYSLKQLLCL